MIIKKEVKIALKNKFFEPVNEDASVDFASKMMNLIMEEEQK